MNLNLQGKKVLVTGGSRGIGFDCCRLFLEEGCDVTLVASDEVRVESAVSRLRQPGAMINGLSVDLSLRTLPQKLLEKLGEVDVVVNNAGAIPGGGLDKVSDEVWRSAWELKLFGYLNVTRAALPSMLARGSGVIINVIGIAGAAPRYDYISGSTANAALIAFTKATGAHASRKGVRVVGVNPGPTETDRLVNLYRSRAAERFGDPERWKEMLSDMPFGRAAKAEEIASLVVFLSSSRSAYVSGTVIDVDGGASYMG
ncbi:short-chain dehydrogenase [Pandoraea eparura]|uniref:Short-chain dehydrogenase n=1 Tax=Pandoraea eparura TaxID=2508291 RepID=A0A5E4U8F9_9BURK|nr:short-chain dehydrogenase/reductase [Pandoraea eparura]VVD95174.1 short-chain dehydrogenase [Pandoraea eparura]